ncbi:mandelate racemase/muconate lactonizing enzyme family protein [Alkalihalobacillus sp. BA299]|uniref:mandelate racemase/muconate lactonizing enzyme family protein n=1 Tax=Alkalihalobacillus sp. BA299 TaxID=2815938 RepID=UPI001ADBBF1A|nr:dipeptide epimerase [Alkalihalobacillus sp. BA299]
MKINKVETQIIETRFMESFHTTYGKIPSSHPHLIVKITTDKGVAGFGEASPLPMFTGETVEIMKVAVDKELGPAIIGQEIFELDEIHKVMNRVLGKASAAKSAIDLALWDLKGKSLNIPVYKLLGGTKKKNLELAYVLGDEPIDQMIIKAEEKRNMGFSTFKIKVGTTPEKDISSVKAIRDALGPDVRIRVDANQGFDVKTALHVINKIAPYSIDYIEPPVREWDIAGLKQVRQGSPIPVMADESLYSPHQALTLIKEEAVDLFAIKLIKTGGITPALKIVSMADAAGIDCVVISPWDSWLGTYANLHFATLLTERYAHELVGPFYLTDDPFGTIPNKVSISINEGSGFGIVAPPSITFET